MSEVFKELLSLSDAAGIWNIDDSTLRKAISQGRLVTGEDVQKFGKQWVVTISAMERLYGAKPE